MEFTEKVAVAQDWKEGRELDEWPARGRAHQVEEQPVQRPGVGSDLTFVRNKKETVRLEHHEGEAEGVKRESE